MTPADLDALLATYAAGMDVQLDLLRQLEAAAGREQASLATPALCAPADILTERDRVMAQLLAVEPRHAELRQLLVTHLAAVQQRPAFAAVAARHREAERLAAAILATDRQSLATLEAGAAERRTLAHHLETGSTTLAAYRRALAPPPAPASILYEQG